MNERALQVGDVVQAVFRPDNVGIVQQVYGSNGEIVDVHRPGLPSFANVPTNAFVLVPTSAVLYGVGSMREGVIQTCRIVSDVAGLQMWMEHTPSGEVAAAYICRLSYSLHRMSEWHVVADLLVEQSAQELEIIK